MTKTKFFRLFDWLVAIGSLAYGIYANAPWWLLGGVLGLGVAWFNPAQVIGDKIKQSVIAKQRK